MKNFRKLFREDSKKKAKKEKKKREEQEKKDKKKEKKKEEKERKEWKKEEEERKRRLKKGKKPKRRTLTPDSEELERAIKAHTGRYDEETSSSSNSRDDNQPIDYYPPPHPQLPKPLKRPVSHERPSLRRIPLAKQSSLGGYVNEAYEITPGTPVDHWKTFAQKPGPVTRQTTKHQKKAQETKTQTRMAHQSRKDQPSCSSYPDPTDFTDSSDDEVEDEEIEESSESYSNTPQNRRRRDDEGDGGGGAVGYGYHGVIPTIVVGYLMHQKGYFEQLALATMSDLFTGLTSSIKSTATAITRNEYVRKVAESMNDAIMNYSKAEMAVREATNEDPWGPTGPQMKKIAEFTRSRYSEDFYNVFTPLFSRMLENNKDAWRRVYKSLVLLDHLIKNGSERFVSETRDKLYELRRLESYKYTDEKGKDQGINIRHRVKLIIELLNDDDKLQAERRKANADDKSKYRGYDQYDIKMGAGGSYNKSNSSFDNNSWNHGGSSKKNDFDDFKSNSREVSNFSFSSSSNNANRSPSPELGFAEERPKKEDDDGFGDFVSSRSSQPAAKNKSTPNPTKTFFDAPPVIKPPVAVGYVAPPLSPVANKPQSNFDLLFDVGSPAPPAKTTPAAPASANLDLFGEFSSPQTIAPVVAAPTAPSTGGLDLFDFGAPVASTVPNTQPTPVAASNGAFNGFDFGAPLNPTGGSSFGGGAPLQPQSGLPQQSQAPKPQVNLGGPSPKVGTSFAGLDQFMTLSLSPSNSNTPKAKTLNQMMGGGL